MNSGRFTVGLMLVLLFPCKSLADIARRNWVLEQIAVLQGLQPPKTKSFFRASFNTVTYSDSFSVQGGALYDARVLEFGVKASQRLYTGLTAEGASQERLSRQEKQNLAFEIARSYLTQDNHFGRVSAEYIYFPTPHSAFLRLGTYMGAFEHAESDWVLRLNFHVFLAFSRNENTVFMTTTELGHSTPWGEAHKLRIGGGLNWLYRTRPEFGVPDRREHMLFSLGPWIELLGPSSSLRLSIPWRIWMDKEAFVSSNGSLTNRYPMLFRLPDIAFSLTVAF